jgi:hypothetical protein
MVVLQMDLKVMMKCHFHAIRLTKMREVATATNA